ncbi:F0F1 ATP synthase subunit delta [Agromyces archimandritae]|uniref:ATP synthase subunit delta n=1 Tax=Agromyces archimandritae TaxID=2781962 RepID=A0A975IQK9_9MICO|nr:F0F1 ATP synthase subunit delta [Agromyces archimandritae]QTX05151.1 F0F1 ATP synthase subunit delta [Agromyces archimandritae]
MGSATSQALADARDAVAKLGTVPAALAEELFSAGLVVGDSLQLRHALSDPEVASTEKRALLGAIFGSKLSPAALELLDGLAAARWSRSSDLLVGIEEAGLRSAAASTEADVSGELFGVERLVAGDAELELALGSKLSPVETKVGVVERLLTGKVSPQTVAIVRHLVQQPRGRRIGELLRHAAAVTADARGFQIATVTSAAPLGEAQTTRLEQSLTAQYGRPLRINAIVDPALVGGLRVQIGDDVIDGTIASRLSALRQKLAG